MLSVGRRRAGRRASRGSPGFADEVACSGGGLPPQILRGQPGTSRENPQRASGRWSGAMSWTRSACRIPPPSPAPRPVVPPWTVPRFGGVWCLRGASVSSPGPARGPACSPAQHTSVTQNAPPPSSTSWTDAPRRRHPHGDASRRASAAGRARLPSATPAAVRPTMPAPRDSAPSRTQPRGIRIRSGSTSATTGVRSPDRCRVRRPVSPATRTAPGPRSQSRSPRRPVRTGTPCPRTGTQS